MKGLSGISFIGSKQGDAKHFANLLKPLGIKSNQVRLTGNFWTYIIEISSIKSPELAGQVSYALFMSKSCFKTEICLNNTVLGYLKD